MADIVETIPKSYRERLDEIPLEGSVLITSEEERNNFQVEMNRSFHKPKDVTKRFSIRTHPVTKETRCWRLL